MGSNRNNLHNDTLKKNLQHSLRDLTTYSITLLLWSRGGGGGGGPEVGEVIYSFRFSPSVGQMCDLGFKFAITTLFIQVITVNTKSSTCVSAKRQKL